MLSATPKVTWEVMAVSAQGFSHSRNGIPNQDSVSSYILPDGSPPAIVAVADGHGSPKSCRSHIGSYIAVVIANEVARNFFYDMKHESPSKVKECIELRKPQSLICDKWRREVEQHYKSNPLSAQELIDIGKPLEVSMKDDAQEVPYFAYGTTLLLAIIGLDYLVCLQIGDGDIIAVSEAQEGAERLIAKDEKIANETDSLCMKDAKKSFRHYFKHFECQQPAMVFLSTDGYYNSFARGEAGYHENCLSFLSTLRKDGIATIRSSLQSWLTDYSRDGSGDDISVGVIVRKDLCPTAKIAEECDIKKTSAEFAIQQPGNPMSPLPELQVKGPNSTNGTTPSTGEDGLPVAASSFGRPNADLGNQYDTLIPANDAPKSDELEITKAPLADADPPQQLSSDCS